MEFKTVDVFSSKPLKGNPVAVVLDGRNLSSAEMQDVARWTNLSETTFVVPPTEQAADYQVRIFTPTEELPFVGHPSLGTAHALLEAGLVPRKAHLVQQCRRGLIDLNVTDKEIEFGLEIIESRVLLPGEIETLIEALDGLNLDTRKPPTLVHAGPRWIVVKAHGTEKDLLSYKPDQAAIESFSSQTNSSGICVFTPRSDGSSSIELRTFAPACGCSEDPVCGSGQAAVAYFRDVGQTYTARQGSAIHRDGAVTLSYKDGKIWVRGACVTVADGRLNI